MLLTASLGAILAGASLLLAVSALPRAGPSSLDTNLGYLSPSLTVPVLAIDTQDVYEGLGKRWTDTYQGNLTFPYGVASGDP